LTGALAIRQTSLEASIRFPVPEAINKNPTFSVWSGASGTFPEDWGDWGNGTSNTKATGSISPNAYRQSHTAGATNYGVQQSLDGKMTQGWYVLEADITLNSGVLTGSGMYFHYGVSGITNSHAFNFATDTDIDGAVNGVGAVGRRYRYAKLVQLVNTANLAQMFLMTNWDVYAASSNAKDLTWHKCLIRPASDSEIELRAARSGSASVGARITTEESARASGDAANASSITTLTARSYVKGNLVKGSRPNYDSSNPNNLFSRFGWGNQGLWNVGYSVYVDGPYLSQGLTSQTAYNWYAMWTNPVPIAAGLPVSAQAMLGKFGTWNAGTLGIVIYWFSDLAGTTLVSGTPNGATQNWEDGLVIQGQNGAARWCRTENQIAPTGAQSFRLGIYIAGATGNGVYTEAGAWMLKAEYGTTCTTWTDEALAVENDARVTVNSGAIATLNSSAAFYQILVAASGGDPALIRLFSGLGGSEVAIAAKILSLVNTTDGSAMEVMRAIGGLAFFRRPISADSSGRRVTIGPGFGVSGSQVVLWFGPDTIAPDDQSRINGYFALGTDGIIYYGSAVLGSPVSATRKVDLNSNGTDTNDSWQTIASVTLSNCPGGNLYFDGSFYNVVSGTGTCDHKARITIDGTLAGSELATQNTVTGGTPSAVIMDDLFAQILTVTAGSRTIAFQLQRTSGSGNVDVSSTRFDVKAFPV
jgi:hypothetical protein